MTKKSNTPVLRLTAADAIKDAASHERLAAPTSKALAELKLLVEHNDTQTNNANRVRWEKAVEILRAHGWLGNSYRALNKVCEKHLGRRSYARA